MTKFKHKPGVAVLFILHTKAKLNVCFSSFKILKVKVAQLTMVLTSETCLIKKKQNKTYVGEP